MSVKRAVNAQELIDVIEHGSLDEAIELIARKPRLLNGYGNNGTRPLIVAAFLNKSRIVESMLEEVGIDLDVTDGRGFNALENAAFGFSERTMQGKYSKKRERAYCLTVQLLTKSGCAAKASGG
jgi:hypothetical protein